jgi:isochorismate hydrolase
MFHHHHQQQQQQQQIVTKVTRKSIENGNTHRTQRQLKVPHNKNDLNRTKQRRSLPIIQVLLIQFRPIIQQIQQKMTIIAVVVVNIDRLIETTQVERAAIVNTAKIIKNEKKKRRRIQHSSYYIILIILDSI